MKILKLIGILLALVVAIVGVIYIPELFHKDIEDTFSDINTININETRDKFISEWEIVTKWDEALHKQQREKVIRYKNNKMITKASYEALLNTIRESSINKMCANYDKALKAETFNHQNIVTAHRDVSKVKKAEGLDTLTTPDHRINRIEKLHKYYLEAKSFAERGQYISANFDTSKLTWHSFDQKKNNILQKAQKLRSNTLYSEVSHIKLISNGLNHSVVADKVQRHYYGFYESLYEQIVNYFNTEEKTIENLHKLASVRNNFSKEAPKSYLDKLLTYENNFEDEVKKLMNEK